MAIEVFNSPYFQSADEAEKGATNTTTEAVSTTS